MCKVLHNFQTTRVFVPSMAARDHGHVVTVTSVAGFLGGDRLSDYSAAKFGIVGYSEALLVELRHSNKSNVHVTIAFPFYMRTNMFQGVQEWYVINHVFDKNKSSTIHCLCSIKD